MKTLIRGCRLKCSTLHTKPRCIDGTAAARIRAIHPIVLDVPVGSTRALIEGRTARHAPCREVVEARFRYLMPLV